MRPFQNSAVAAVFDSYPVAVRRRMLVLRELVFSTAARSEGVGQLTETLKWGEPAYLTQETKSGSTVRIGWKRAYPNQYAIYFNCQTTLVETFKTMFPHDLRFEGNRAIVLDAQRELPADTVAWCLAVALTYHQRPARESKVQVSPVVHNGTRRDVA